MNELREKFNKIEDVFKKHNLYRDDFMNMVAYYILDKGFSRVASITDEDIESDYNELVADERAREKANEEAKKNGGKIRFSIMTPEFAKALETCARDVVKCGDIGDTMAFLMRYVNMRGLKSAEFDYTNPDRYEIYAQGGEYCVRDIEGSNRCYSGYLDVFDSKEKAEKYVDNITSMYDYEAERYVSLKKIGNQIGNHTLALDTEDFDWVENVELDEEEIER